MGSCIVKKNSIIVTKVTMPETYFYNSQKNPSNGIETIQTSNCLKMYSSKSKIQWNSIIKKQIELSGYISKQIIFQIWLKLISLCI